ncbi:hypothetical protein DAEQUDRAFT_765800 [Daedalea quercina L-15889]|uniref:Uncharacterized protein n=1 Tax=Daedalea quercina L-15889 TaxID=1314783 RepID=A0A165Q5B0_9APHY|nr:hypothetical protein DAEQUDRAFT_765800 [Daedalea quercina L-15889]
MPPPIVMAAALREHERRPERRRSRSPPVASRSYAPTPPTPSSPHPSVLPAKPAWSRRSTRQAGTPTVESPSTTAKPALPSHSQTKPKDEPDHPELKALAVEIAQAHAQRLKAAKEYKEKWLEGRRIIHEFEVVDFDFRAAEMRRIIADDQLERAKAGELGIEYNGVPAELPAQVS